MRKHIAVLLISCVAFLCAQFSYAVTATQLKSLLNDNAAITVIDVRINALYQKCHIHNAINIPASVIERKRLPELGKVIVYGDGIDDDAVEQAVARLNAKPGIEAEALEGGFSAWSARHNVVTRQSGLEIRQTRNVTYKKLRKMVLKGGSLILVDLRMGREQESLSEHFPGTRIYDPIAIERDDIGNVAVTGEILAGIPKRNSSVLILIDDGSGFSEKVADKLHAAGVKRLAILTGGELALRAKGESTEEVRRSSGE